MAKLKPSLTPISGTVDGLVHVDSTRYGMHVRKAIKKGSRKDNPVLKAQYERNVFLNGLASEINSIIRSNSGMLKSSGFYHDVLKRFRKEPLNNRFLVLRKLQGMEVDKRHRLGNKASWSVAVAPVEGNLVVTLRTESHPSQGRHKEDCYYYELLMVTWKRDAGAGTCSKQWTEWMDIKKGNYQFRFEFLIDADVVHWMLCMRVKMGVNEKEIDSIMADGMGIVGVGSLDEAEVRMAKDREEAERVLQDGGERKEVGEVVRVKGEEVK